MKTLIIYGPAGCGKTRYAERIRKHFNLDRVFDDWGGTFDITDGRAVYFTNDDWLAAELRAIGVHPVMSFEEVAKQINDAIPRTQWFQVGVLPVHEGVYETTDKEYMMDRNQQGFQLWNGSYWGGFGMDANDAVHGFEPGFASSYQENYWRGLAEEPILISK